MISIGFDTSNYTTSCAAYDGTSGKQFAQLLPVQPGALGLRQSEALFHHVKRLPELSDRLFAHIQADEIRAIGVSTRPRAVEGSYMPCFLAGESQARTLASLLHVPLFQFSHQQGHIAAVLWSSGRMDLFGKTFLAWHLSGGTTELLLVHTENGEIQCDKIGGTTDISAGQLIDRTGQLLGLQFPAGKALDALASRSTYKDRFAVKVNACAFSLSGLENQVRSRLEQTGCPEDTARFALRSVIRAVRIATEQARERYPYPVVFSGGVSSNLLLRQEMESVGVFSEPIYAIDNAMGIAVLTHMQEV